MRKTSETHPLRIDSVPVGSLGGLIGRTLCPGKRVARALSTFSSASGGKYRHSSGDSCGSCAKGSCSGCGHGH